MRTNMKTKAQSRQPGSTLRSIVMPLVLCFVALQINAISPKLCEPRTGDRVTVDILDAKHHLAIDNADTVSLVNIAPLRKSVMQIWNPVPEDTIAKYYITLENELKKIAALNGQNRVIYQQRPGYSRRFSQGLPYGLFQQSVADEPYETRCHMDGVMDCHSRGNSSTCTFENICLITPEADTLKNVTLVRTVVTDSLYYPDATHFHCGTYKSWYAPGYRYPILFATSDSIIDTDSGIIDSDHKLYAISPFSQENEIKDDPVNEEIRYTRSNNNNTGEDYDRTGIKNRNGDTPSSVTWKGDKSLVVTRIFDENEMTEIILCDVNGRIFYYHECNDSSSEYNIDLSGCPPGLYLLHIAGTSDPTVYRFRL